MKKRLLLSVAAVLLTLQGALAQGLVGGAQEGSEEGARRAGPVGGVIGGVLGGVVGGVTGLLGVDARPRFKEYVVRERHPSYRYEGSLDVGGELPDQGVTYYEVPAEYGVRDYRYTVVNGRTVLVDPRTRRIVQVVE